MSILANLSRDEISALPKRTIIELSSPAGQGDRRRQIKQVIIPMIADAGMDTDRLFDCLRPAYDSDFTDRELRDLIRDFHRKKDQYGKSKTFSEAGGIS